MHVDFYNEFGYLANEENMDNEENMETVKVEKKQEFIDVKVGNCCCSCSAPANAKALATSRWKLMYFLKSAIIAVAWTTAYIAVEAISNWVIFDILNFESDSHIGKSIEFFIYDTVKILLLLFALIYVIAWLRASLNVERVRDYLAGKKRGLGYFLGAMFGSITPFCSCSSIPLFLGFTTARIPFGITMAFLITSPVINEIAVVLLWELLGWKFTVIYVLTGMAAGIIGGCFMDAIKAERWLQPFMLGVMQNPPVFRTLSENKVLQKLTMHQRHTFAWGEMQSIFGRVWKWVVLGVGIGAALHGFVPDNWFAAHFGADAWWTVPAAVFMAIPLYSNVTGIVPIMESLLLKGLPIGTTLAFCMSAVAASIPEVILLRQIMTFRLQAVFIFYLWVIFTLVGYLFNIAAPYLA